MPIVTIQQGPRDVELKRDLVKRVTDAFVDAYRIPAESVHVWIHEVPHGQLGQCGEADRRQVETSRGGTGGRKGASG